MASNLLKYYQSKAAMTITLASLADDSTNLLTGRTGTEVDNTTNLYADYHVAGQITTGTSPTAGKTIEIWAFANLDGLTHTLYPDTLTGADAGATLTSANVKGGFVKRLKQITVDSTTARAYPFGPISIDALFNGVPPYWNIFVINGSGVALNATAGNHVINYWGLGYKI